MEGDKTITYLSPTFHVFSACLYGKFRLYLQPTPSLSGSHTYPCNAWGYTSLQTALIHRLRMIQTSQVALGLRLWRFSSPLTPGTLTPASCSFFQQSNQKSHRLSTTIFFPSCIIIELHRLVKTFKIIKSNYHLTLPSPVTKPSLSTTSTHLFNIPPGMAAPSLSLAACSNI